MTEAKEEEKKSSKVTGAGDKLYLLMQMAQTKAKPCSEKKYSFTDIMTSPWRASVPWWYSVNPIKYGDSSQTVCKIMLKGKTYEFPQMPQKVDNKEINHFYEKQVHMEQEKKKEEFLQDFKDTLWMTYRKDFAGMKGLPGIPKQYQYASDSGWGCMVRSSQMLMSNCILRHLFADKRFSLAGIEGSQDDKVKYLSLLWQQFALCERGRFMDSLNGENAAFSIANMVEVGLRYGIKPKDWYGPSTVIQILNELNQKYNPFPGLKTAVFPEGVIYKEEVLSRGCDMSAEELEKHKAELDKKWKNAVIVLVGFRLGLDTISPENFDGIFRLLDQPQCVGMVGGQGRGALYFVGYQDRELIFLDPHVTQAAVGKVVDLWAEHLTYHYSTPLKLPIEKLDTCVAYGFYLGNYAEYLKFVEIMTKELGAKDSFVQISEKPPVCEERDIDDSHTTFSSLVSYSVFKRVCWPCPRYLPYGPALSSI